MPLIKITDLCKDYANDGVLTKVLHHLNFEIAKGEFTALMAPSGSGKSTLMHILGLLDRPTCGIYELDGKDVTKLSDDELAELRNHKMGFVFQSFNLLPRTSVLENVKLPLFYGHAPIDQHDELAKRALESVGLEHRLHYLSNQLSGGEKQRVAIARALVTNPEVIFADEPTGNLDSKSGGQVMEILQTLNQSGRTIILVTHETYTAEHAQRIIRLKDGEIVSDEKVRDRKTAGDGLIK
ncbi:MAG TPA: macrolide ABC transporter ATP-binding protein [Candidatus Magasanikbacteria bacterium]|uniref:ABC transporter related protein n=2 Tax=Candidatus Magasanikiibacteriota TaxID=1752731 RepID=A0A0G0WKW5_9BACT|nr:MAG: ABC transporter related protein [Candidatus Magasanikbacteria bacterium GW2011_GWC2_41_17]KKS13470.1 MAG: ABC transporter related protein [Candidatus Magasanikbacteria bacterium GW2011_GWA2_41_55]HBV57892.1 macrolide ABC transporter ATP-binding protein [Candidatus Magasanikbacteria bacterium]HBX16491.1 macrolide ABC transporter ATP-binding protein [Candidatus Magasanikbacteria bacterium]